MREIRLSGSEGGGTGNSTGPPYPYPQVATISVGTGDDGATHGPEYPENARFFCRSGPCPRTCRKRRMFRWGRPCLRTDRKRLMGWFRGHGPLLPQVPATSVGTGGEGVTQAREYAENAGFFGRSGPCPRNPSPDRSLRVPGRVPTPERGHDHLAPWCTRRTRRPPRAVRVREMFPYFPENRKKIRNGPFFLHDPGWLRRSSVGRSAAPVQRTAAAPSP